ncbi:MAG: hypothetical protein WC099_00415 [Candidatus Paceibacterota bacterium]
MANLSTNEKQLLEKLFNMGSGYVLNFSDRTMSEFFRDDVGIDIYNPQYKYASGSKANYMRGFWQNASDVLVGKSIQKLIEYIENQILLGHLNEIDFSIKIMDRGKQISNKLQGTQPQTNEIREDDFLSKDFRSLDVNMLKLDGTVLTVIQQRIDEIQRCLKINASLSVIFLCGSTMEGILLGIASNNAKDFNIASASPKDKSGKVKQFQDWSLSDFINVARELNFLGEDVKKFSHALRDFRNYIHPYQQLASSFDPDEHTAKICWQVLQAAIVQLSK